MTKMCFITIVPKIIWSLFFPKKRTLYFRMKLFVSILSHSIAIKPQGGCVHVFLCLSMCVWGFV